MTEQVSAHAQGVPTSATSVLADKILDSKRRGNHPCNNGESGKRLVGWIMDEDVVGLSEGLFAIEEIERRALRFRLAEGEATNTITRLTMERDEARAMFDRHVEWASSQSPAEKAVVAEEERHAVEHMRYSFQNANEDNPDCCFDYELIGTILNMLDRRSQPASDK